MRAVTWHRVSRSLGWACALGLFIGIDQIIKSYPASPFINREVAWIIPFPLAFITASAGLLVLTALLWMAASRALRLGLLIVSAGGLANLIDRLTLGGVRDVMHVGSLWFNLADILVITGAIVVITQAWLKQAKSSVTIQP